ncbi:erlin-2-b [Phtheirospermum japonicum]|uniref:Erlin-2-b n=1 Tax=Phtheirospermum japonicum TaxID=374723 RepID=A0A830BWM1_9LAMI|nr:erlin-2-b [Phtheirospermum japonicum]
MDAQQQRAAASQPRPPAGGGGDSSAIFPVLLSVIAIAAMVDLFVFDFGIYNISCDNCYYWNVIHGCFSILRSLVVLIDPAHNVCRNDDICIEILWHLCLVERIVMTNEQQRDTHVPTCTMVVHGMGKTPQRVIHGWESLEEAVGISGRRKHVDVLGRFSIIKVIVPSASNLKQSLSILHQVPEGHVGVYWRGGALLDTITGPGFHLKMPLLTHFEPIQVTLQTDLVRDIPCGTKGGVMINFEKIEVVNRLHKDYVFDTLLNYGVQYDNTWIYDKIHHEINQFCSAHSLQQVYIDMFDQIDEKMKDALQADCTRYAPGIEIISVRVTKPTIPESIRRNFEQMEEERTKVLIAMEKQRVSEKEAETHKKIAISEAEKYAHVSKIQMEQKLMEKDSLRRQEEIANSMYLAREKSLADADYYRTIKEAEANKLKLTSQYLELKFIEAIANNSKIYFGNKIPNMVLDQRLLGNFLQDADRKENLEA